MTLFRDALKSASFKPTPLKSILKSFEIYNKKGFNEDMVADTILFLGKKYQERGPIAPVYEDFEQHELFENWRF